MDPFIPWYVAHLASRDARSALPQAPIRPDRRGQQRGAIRHRSAAVLHRLADRVDPGPPPVSAAHRCGT